MRIIAPAGHQFCIASTLALSYYLQSCANCLVQVSSLTCAADLVPAICVSILSVAVATSPNTRAKLKTASLLS